jgi:hypothetical protein
VGIESPPAVVAEWTIDVPRDGATIFSDLAGKLDVLAVECEKCGRAGKYRVDRLVRDLGRDAKLTDWLANITADCPRKLKPGYGDPCGARCPDLPKVF